MRASNLSYLTKGRASIVRTTFARRSFLNGFIFPLKTPARDFSNGEKSPKLEDSSGTPSDFKNVELKENQSEPSGHWEQIRWTKHVLNSPTEHVPHADAITTIPDKHETRINVKHTAYISVGSNLGNRVGWIEKALNLMAGRGLMKVKRTSSLWETEPMYVLEQENFINGVIEIETHLTPLKLLEKLQGIEKSLGRKKVIDKGPRNIDLDILLYDDVQFNHKDLIIPHIGIYEREFVLRPLAQLIPGVAINQAQPWKLTQDYLNDLPSSESPMSTVTPLTSEKTPLLRALQPHRKTHLMGILNLTPDSFSDGGILRLLDSSANKMNYFDEIGSTLNKFVKADVTIVDIGGQSTAPNAAEVTTQEEIDRTVNTIQWIRSGKRRDTIISIDTYRAAVAKAAINAGADIINDVSAGQLDPAMLKVMANSKKTVCLMHMRGNPQTMNALTDYSPDGLIPTIAKELLARVQAAEEVGVRRWRIILDPGIGFAKTAEQNLEILRRFEELRNWPGLVGFPWLVGSSRKGFIGSITGVDVPKDRVFGTAVTVAAAVQAGADMVRVHDVTEMAQVVKMSDAIWRSTE